MNWNMVKISKECIYNQYAPKYNDTTKLTGSKIHQLWRPTAQIDYPVEPKQLSQNAGECHKTLFFNKLSVNVIKI